MTDAFRYELAFGRNRGLVTDQEQLRIRQARALIVGCGGVGGSHAIALARMGLGHFRLVDPDTFDWPNFNRQIGASVSTVGASKAETIARMIRDINPEAICEVVPERLSPSNVAELVSGCDVVMDGIDFFAIEARRTACTEAKRQGVSVVNVGPIGMSAACIVFSPTGMSFDDYFDLRDGMTRAEMLLNFFVGLTPAATQRPYMDMAFTNLEREFGPSLGPTCLMCSGVAAIEALRVLLGRDGLCPAPDSFQFDAYRHLFVRRRLRWGNRGPLQRIKRMIARKMLSRHFPELSIGSGHKKPID